MRASDTLPELAEADAPASVRAIYRGLREGASTPIAALIWRHIATHPGVLEACWAAIGPMFETGALPEAGWRIARETVRHGLLPPLAPRAQRLLGIAGDDAATIRALAEAYNRANPANMLAVLTLLARCSSDATAEAAPASSAARTPPAAITQALPRMTPPAEMTMDVRWLLNDLGFGDRTQLDPVVPSLFRHLTDWPAYLAALHMTLAPRFRDGRMAADVARVEQTMAAEASSLARQIAPVPQLAANPQLVATMRRFAGGFIPMMIVIGRGIDEQLA